MRSSEAVVNFGGICFRVDADRSQNYPEQEYDCSYRRGFMARLSRQTREIIKIVIAVVIVGVVLFFYVIYPLNKVESVWGREASAQPSDTTVANDPSAFLESGLAVDTFRIDVDAVTKLAGLYVRPQAAESAQIRGTVLLVHGNRQNRDALATLGKVLLDSGYNIAAYDQRASGRSTGEYHGDGQLEADDMEALIAYLDIRGKIVHPFIVVGYETGADAAIYAAREDSRINRIVAVGPYLTTEALAEYRQAAQSPLWFPFRSTVFWWWYTIRSGYATPRQGIDSVLAASVPTIVLASPDRIQQEEVRRFDQVSPDTLVTVEPLAADSAAAEAQIVATILRK